MTTTPELCEPTVKLARVAGPSKLAQEILRMECGLHDTYRWGCPEVFYIFDNTFIFEGHLFFYASVPWRGVTSLQDLGDRSPLSSRKFRIRRRHGRSPAAFTKEETNAGDRYKRGRVTASGWSWTAVGDHLNHLELSRVQPASRKMSYFKMKQIFKFRGKLCGCLSNKR